MARRYPKSKYGRLNNIFVHMKQRCYNPSNHAYDRYGGRGIFIHKQWLDDPDEFCEWALTHGYQDDLSIDRINNDDGYYPENCHWIPLKEQNDNRSTGLGKFLYKGEEKTLLQWCTELNLSYDAMRNRIVNKKMSVEEAFETPLQTEKASFNQLCRDHGMNPITVRSRVEKFGWDLETALNTPVTQRVSAHNTKTFERVCPVCGKHYETHSHKAIFCSKSCNKKTNSVSYRRNNPEKFEVINGVWHFKKEGK